MDEKGTCYLESNNIGFYREQSIAKECIIVPYQKHNLWSEYFHHCLQFETLVTPGSWHWMSLSSSVIVYSSLFCQRRKQT